MALPPRAVCVFFAVVGICFGTVWGEEIIATVYPHGKLAFGILDKENGVAYGIFNDSLQASGWGTLSIKSGYGNLTNADSDIMYAAGFLEGAITSGQMYNHYLNIKSFFLSDKSPAFIAVLQAFLSKQDLWTRAMVKEYSSSDVFWRYVGLILAQFDGLVDGYSTVASPSQALDSFAFQILNGAGDLLDLVTALDKKGRPDFEHMTREELKTFVMLNTHCSALIKMLPGFENLFMSHSSWFIYSGTNRIFKYYDFNVQDENAAAKQMAFSSYPGFLESLDDFYLLSSGLVMLQTTNNVFNLTLYNYVQPESVLAWIRVRVANMVAVDGKQWANLLATQNSGTYNNQYMVINLNLIQLNSTIQDGALYVVEQIPTLVEYGDQTDILRAGYWASYNVPFYERVYNLSGYPDIVKRQGVDFSYQLAPRAKIFRRDQSSVTSVDAMQDLMRYNNYKKDPYSEGNACDSICCRGDLTNPDPRPSGCYDTKVSDYAMAKALTASVINGPTISSGLPAFDWSVFPNSTHYGLPKIYNFPFVRMTPLDL